MFDDIMLPFIHATIGMILVMFLVAIGFSAFSMVKKTTAKANDKIIALEKDLASEQEGPIIEEIAQPPLQEDSKNSYTGVIIAFTFLIVALLMIILVPKVIDKIDEVKYAKEIKIALEQERKQHIQETSLEDLAEEELRRLEAEEESGPEPMDESFRKLVEKYEKMAKQQEKPKGKKREKPQKKDGLQKLVVSYKTLTQK